MLEIDFIAVGDSDKSGDATCLRFTDPATQAWVTVVVDAGFEATGQAVVEHVRRQYGQDQVDLVVSTHPDADHIGGLGHVLRGLGVGAMWIHRPGLHGASSNTGHRPAEELTALAEAQGALVTEPFTGVNDFGQALVVAGPSEEFYEQTLVEQATSERPAERSAAAALAEAIAARGRQFLDVIPGEAFFSDAGGTNPRNQSAVILDLQVAGQRVFLPSDAGVPAIQASLDALDSWGRTSAPVTFLQAAHHGSRYNLDRDTATRLLGEPGQGEMGRTYVNVAPDSDRPSGTINNALLRRGYPVYETRGQWIWFRTDDAPQRYGNRITPLGYLPED